MVAIYVDDYLCDQAQRVESICILFGVVFMHCWKHIDGTPLDGKGFWDKEKSFV